MPSKKKKPAANPARGFATTSIAKKAVPEEQPAKEEAGPAEQTVGVSKQDVLNSVSQELQTASESRSVQPELHELSPEALEARLEEEEVQLLVAKYGPQVQRAVDRQVNKTSTDYRVLRGHAQFLPTRTLLPLELESKVLELAKQDLEDSAVATLPSVRNASFEEDYTTRLWTLQRILRALGFTKESVERALSFALRLGPDVDKDSPVWALDECLDWLTLKLEEDELPVYDQTTGKARDEVHDQYDSTALDVSAVATRKAKPKKSAETIVTTPSTAPTTGLPSEDEVEINVSDLESDLEPEELVTTYVASKTSLYELKPDLFDNGKKGANKSQMSSSTPATLSAVKKLQAKMQRIESDVLFDQYEADSRWLLKRNEIAQDVAERRRYQLPSHPTPAAKAADVPLARSQRQPKAVSESSSEESDIESLEDDDDAFGDLFAATAPDEKPHVTIGSDSKVDPTQIIITNFGQIQGVSPWRVLEETCKSRDSRATFAYKVVSEGAFSSRHAMTISWSKDQDIVLPINAQRVASSQTPRTTSFTMLTIATPDADQSKAYIATFALFQIFSSSIKEEKAYMRLPPAFKDVYLSFAEQKKLEMESADQANFKQLRELVRTAIGPQEDETERDDVVLTRNFKQRNTDSGRTTPKVNDVDLDPAIKIQQLKDIWAYKSSTAAYQRMYQSRQQLPMHKFKADALAIIEQNQVTILCGETGCGKSTQLPSFVLEHELTQGRACKIYCTEPRRISAITLAQRVAEELGEHRADVGTMRSLVGYAIRLESQVSQNTKLVFATTGIVLRMLESQDGFQDITHIIVDEVHERSIETDFLLIILRSLIVRRPSLKVVLMSATVDSQKFSKYFGAAPVIQVPGRTFPVETRFLEDAIELTGYSNTENRHESQAGADDVDSDEASLPSTSKTVDQNYWKQYSPRTRSTISTFEEYRINYDLIVSLIHSVAQNPQLSRYSQAILVFLPGIQEIRRLTDMLHGSQLAQGFIIHALHSALSSDEQQAAFAIPPQGYRKIVISTNIAETGVTIPDITCVIDTGKHKEMRFDERRQISRLIESFISRANAKQRRGRAGRVQEGLCFHLFTKSRHDEQIAEQQTPEMLRLSLQDLIMRVKICKLGDIQPTLAEALDPPSAKNIQRAIDALIEVGALTNGENLTVLGQQLSKLPLDPYLGKLVLYGALFNCLDVSLTIAAVLTSKSIFVTPMGGRSQSDAARASFKKGDSDLLTEYNAYSAWRRVCTNATTSQFSQESQFCRKNMLSSQTLGNIEDLKAQLMSAVADAGLVSLHGHDRSALSRIQNSAHHRARRFVQIPDIFNANNDNVDLVSSTIAWAFYPKLLTRDGKGWRNVATNQTISVHPTSIIRSTPIPHVKYMSFYSILQSSGTKHYNAASLTAAPPLPLLLLAGATISFHPTAGVASIDGARLRFQLDSRRTAVAIKYLRRALEEVVERKWKKPEAVLPRRLARWWEVWEEIVRGWEKGGA